MSAPEQAMSELDRRVSDTVDLFGHPCLVLAEHVAQSARDLRGLLWRTVEDFGGPWNKDFKLRHWYPERYTEGFIDAVDCPEVRLPVVTAEIAELADDSKAETPVTGIQLAAPLRVGQFVGKRLLRKQQSLSILELDLERPMWLTARARGVAYPILHISQRPTHEENADLQPTDAPRAPCAFVSEATSMLGEVGEPVLYGDDIKDPRRKAQLEMFYQILQSKLKKLRFEENSRYTDYTELITFGASRLNDEEFARTGATEKFEQIFGPVNMETEHVISAVMGMVGTQASFKGTTVQQGVEYPAKMTLAVSSVPDGFVARSRLELTSASGMGPMPLMPTLRVYPHRRDPLQFEDTKDEQVPGILKTFVELLEKLQASTAPEEK